MDHIEYAYQDITQYITELEDFSGHEESLLGSLTVLKAIVTVSFVKHQKSH